MTHDSADEDAFKFYENNYVLTFFCIKNGLYYQDTSNWKINLFNIVSETIIGFSETRIKKAKEGKGYLCNLLLSHSKISYKSDHNQHANEMSSDCGRYKIQ